MSQELLLLYNLYYLSWFFFVKKNLPPSKRLQLIWYLYQVCRYALQRMDQFIFIVLIILLHILQYVEFSIWKRLYFSNINTVRGRTPYNCLIWEINVHLNYAEGWAWTLDVFVVCKVHAGINLRLYFNYTFPKVVFRLDRHELDC